MAATVFFVLRGLLNGERDVRALWSDGEVMPDGWYSQREGEDPRGPMRSREEAQEVARPKLDDLDVDAVLDALWLGKLRPLMADDRMAFADASDYALCGEVGDFFVIFDVKPGVNQPPHCEVHLAGSDEWALINLRTGTWERG